MNANVEWLADPNAMPGLFIGDGKIIISTVDDAIRVRTGETGEAAI